LRLGDKLGEGGADARDLGRIEDPPASPWLAGAVDEFHRVRPQEALLSGGADDERDHVEVPVDRAGGEALAEAVGDVAVEGGNVEHSDRELAEVGDEVSIDDRSVAVRGRALQPLRGRISGEPVAGDVGEDDTRGAT
jgi:hypothetical protein